MKTPELTGAALDWAVAKCKGLSVRWSAPHEQLLIEDKPYSIWQPHKDWAQGGPIILEMGNYCQEGNLESSHFYCSTPSTAKEWHDHPVKATGPTPLIAAMRCYVASKLGDNIDIPEELK